MNEKGITLLELLLTVTIFIAIVCVLPLIMNASLQEVNADFQHEEAQLFFHLFSKEVRESSRIQIHNGGIEMLSNNGTTIRYERYGSSIRRRVNNAGHEIVLQNIQELFLEVTDGRVIVEVELADGQKEKRAIFQMSHKP